MSEAPDTHVCEISPRNGPQNLGEGRSATRRRQRGQGRVHIPKLTGHLHEAKIPNVPWRFA